VRSDDDTYFTSFCNSYNGTGSTSSTITTSSSTSTSSSPSAPTCTPQYHACSDDSGCAADNYCRKSSNQPVGNCYCRITSSSMTTTTTTTSSSPPAPTCTNQYFACSDDSGCAADNYCRRSGNEPVGNCYCRLPSTTVTSTAVTSSSVTPAPSACLVNYAACSSNSNCCSGICNKRDFEPVGNCMAPANGTVTYTSVSPSSTTPAVYTGAAVAVQKAVGAGLFGLVGAGVMAAL